MPAPGAQVLRTGMVTAVGMGAAQTFTSIQAGVAAFANSSVCDASFQPIVMALLPEDALPEPVGDTTGLTSRERRLLRLATPALQEVLADLEAAGLAERTPLFLATPEQHPDLAAPVRDGFLDRLAAQLEPLGLRFDRRRSHRVAAGRAGGLQACAEALAFLATNSGNHALVCGVDSFLDLMLLGTLDRDRRLLGPRVMDGFIPGEGAGVVLLGRPGAPAPDGFAPLAQLVAVAPGTEPGHRYSEEPYKGEGLAAAFVGVLTQGPQLRAPMATMFAGLNGESFGAKEYGVASLRSSAALAPQMMVEHPADCFGDIGAALGPVMLGLAAEGLARGRYAGPALVWCANDGAERCAAVVDIVEPGR